MLSPKVILFLVAWLVIPSAAYADKLFYEVLDGTNARSRKMLITARLSGMDVSGSGLATFSYVESRTGNNASFSIHISRIYSVEFNDQEVMDRPVEGTARQLESPVRGNLTAPRLLQVTTPFRASHPQFADTGDPKEIKATLLGYDANADTFTVSGVDGSGKPVEVTAVPRAWLLFWIRTKSG